MSTSADLKHQIEKEVSAEIHRIMSHAQLAAADAKLHDIKPDTVEPTINTTTTSNTANTAAATHTLYASPQKVWTWMTELTGFKWIILGMLTNNYDVL